MTATWTTPATWTDLQFVTAANLNTHLRDNLDWLKSRPLNQATMTLQTTTSLSFVEMATSSIALTSVGGNILIAANGTVSLTVPGVMYFDLAIDGTRQGDATNGLAWITTPVANYNDNLGIVFMTASPPSATSHNYSIYWKVSTGTASSVSRVYAMEIR